MAATSLADRLRAEIHERGPIPVSRFVDAALYDPDDGFFMTGGRAGRRGDFITAPEVGPLFGAVISNAVDAWWRAAGEPERFVVVEHAAGPGTLARTVTLADGACVASGALRWVMVEPSALQRAQHPDGPHLVSCADDTDLGPVDVVFANELLDNLPFDIVVRTDHGWAELVVDVDGDTFVLASGDDAPAPFAAPPCATGTTLPTADRAVEWITTQRRRHPDARLVVLDYLVDTATLAERDGAWLRAFREHQRIDDWLSHPGSTDLTIDVPLEPVATIGSPVVRTQAAFLRAHGIDALVDEGRTVWTANAHIADLAALRARSRITEAAALLDPEGMGAFVVAEWEPSGPTS